MSEDERYRKARMTAEARYGFRSHLYAYLVVNAGFVVWWFVEGGFESFFWPIFPLVFWGLFVFGHWNDVHKKGEWVTRETKKILQKEED